ncbi:MAG: rimM [Oscillospiraceae bacterium]|jgi:16S rRNA processing protein RimM|nr:rimM [Oscillospiraceae bacterium]
MEEKSLYLEIGKIVSTHGIHGEVRVQPWCNTPEFLTEFYFLYLDRQKKRIEIERSRAQKNIVIMKIQGVDDIEQALALRNKIVYASREDMELEEGSYFIQDLIGIKVIDADNSEKSYGTLTDVLQTGANDVYQITDENKKEVLIPAIADVVIKTDLENNQMVIRPLKGLFDDED